MFVKWKYDYFTEKFRHIPDNLQIVCTGTTQAHFAFDFSDCNISFFNMAVWLNYFTYSRLLLEKYRNKISRHAWILITLQYPIFLCSRASSFTKDNELQYSKILFGKDIDISIIRQLGYRILPDSIWSDEDFESIKNIELRNRKVNHYKIWELENLAENVVHAWEKEIKCSDLERCGDRLTCSQRARMESAMKDVTEIIDFCRKNEWIPVLLSLPFSKIMNDRVPDNFKRNCFYRCIAEITEKTECRWLDYSQDMRLENIHYYMDVWWMNERGRKEYTKIVWDDLMKDKRKTIKE